VLPVRNRMRRSTEFDATMKHGVRAIQPDMVVYARVASGDERRGEEASGPRIGLIIAKSVGSAVERHRVARRLRHVARCVVNDLDRDEQVVIRALPSSRYVTSKRLKEELRAGLPRVGQLLTGTEQ
jgi:ribonuclease P protein component